MSKLTILKIGGALLQQPEALSDCLRYFHELPGHKILVHGGGRRASQISKAMGLTPRMHEGRRLTDEATLEVVTMVYAGLENKRTVAQLQALGCPAIGLSGADANIILSEKRKSGAVDYGYAGDVVSVQSEQLRALLEAGLVPVCCAITHDGQGQLLNTNADTIAASLAAGLAPYYGVELQYCFEQPGVMRDIKDPASLIPSLNPDSYAYFRANGVIVDGMVPKLDNAFRAVQAGAKRAVIADLAGLKAGIGTEVVD